MKNKIAIQGPTLCASRIHPLTLLAMTWPGSFGFDPIRQSRKLILYESKASSVSFCCGRTSD
jgi:hypothetical protein